MEKCGLCVEYLNRRFLARMFFFVGTLVGVIILLLPPVGLKIFAALICFSIAIPGLFADVTRRSFWIFLDAKDRKHIHRKPPTGASAELQHDWFGMPFSKWKPGIAFGLKVSGYFNSGEILLSERLRERNAYSIIDGLTNNRVITVRDGYGTIFGGSPELLTEFLRHHKHIVEGIRVTGHNPNPLMTALTVAIEGIKRSKQTMGRSKAAQLIREYLEKVQALLADDCLNVLDEVAIEHRFDNIWRDVEARIMAEKGTSPAPSEQTPTTS